MKKILKKILKIALYAVYSFILIAGTLSYIVHIGEVTVLEVSIVEGEGDAFDYRVSYSEKAFFGKRTSHIDFQTFLGIDNYLDEVADHDLSQWRATKQ